MNHWMTQTLNLATLQNHTSKVHKANLEIFTMMNGIIQLEHTIGAIVMHTNAIGAIVMHAVVQALV